MPNKEIAQIAWKSPSNIAFIKYWGKHGVQLPANPSLSMTLDKCSTETKVRVYPRQAKGKFEFEFYFHGNKNPVFDDKIAQFFTRLEGRMSLFKNYRLIIESENNFPHAAGIASSASAMSALALCLATIEQRLLGGINGDFYKVVSQLARIGSGSAARSLFKEFAVWGKSDIAHGSSDEFACPLKFPVHNKFRCLRDTILIVDKGEKKVSSTAGHSLMNNHPYAKQRFSEANKNLNELVSAMRTGNFELFAQILEHEALSLHAMMLTASPWYTLFTGASLEIMQKVRDFREVQKIELTFTLDAGPNVHLIYPAEEDNKVREFIEAELLVYCQDNQFIADSIGMGPELLVDKFK